MNKTAFIFPGQGSQYLGMGKEFYDSYPIVKEIFEKASKASGLDVADLCFLQEEKLPITEYTQIAIVTVEVAILKVLESMKISCDMTAGLSLGEYSALVAAGALKMEDAFAIVRKRGIFMQEAVPTGGSMAAILGLDTDKIEAICNNIENVSVANYNCPGQIVITGSESAVADAMEKCKEAGAKRCIALNVSGPFHSPLLKQAGERLGEVLDTIDVQDLRIPYLANVTGNPVGNSSIIKELLTEQVTSSVKWQQSVEKMIEEGVDLFIEIGPGKTLSGFIKKINKECNIISIETPSDLEKLQK